MEAIGEFLPDPAARPGSVVAFTLPELAAVRSAAGSTGSAAEAVHSSVAVDGSVVEALALLRASTASAAADAAGLDFFEASDFADQVEDLSRTSISRSSLPPRSTARAARRPRRRKRPRAGARTRPPLPLPAG